MAIQQKNMRDLPMSVKTKTNIIKKNSRHQTPAIFLKYLSALTFSASIQFSAIITAKFIILSHRDNYEQRLLQHIRRI
jgi:hypothetical protein